MERTGLPQGPGMTGEHYWWSARNIEHTDESLATESWGKSYAGKRCIHTSGNNIMVSRLCSTNDNALLDQPVLNSLTFSSWWRKGCSACPETCHCEPANINWSEVGASWAQGQQTSPSGGWNKCEEYRIHNKIWIWYILWRTNARTVRITIS